MGIYRLSGITLSREMEMTNEISNERLEEMLAGLQGVTPGPWQRHEPEEEETLVITGDEHGETIVVVPWGREITRAHEMGTAHRDADHIARCDPDTMRSILTELLSRRSADGEAVKAVDGLAGPNPNTSEPPFMEPARMLKNTVLVASIGGNNSAYSRGKRHFAQQILPVIGRLADALELDQ